MDKNVKEKNKILPNLSASLSPLYSKHFMNVESATSR